MKYTPGSGWVNTMSDGNGITESDDEELQIKRVSDGRPYLRMGKMNIYFKDDVTAMHWFGRLFDTAKLNGLLPKRAASEAQTAPGEKLEGTSQSEAATLSQCSNRDCCSHHGIEMTEYGPLCAPCREGMAKDHEPVEARALGLEQ